MKLDPPYSDLLARARGYYRQNDRADTRRTCRAVTQPKRKRDDLHRAAGQALRGRVQWAADKRPRPTREMAALAPWSAHCC
jgi:hypothetical protein